MPKGNRVEALEEQVSRLEATVDGLTEELVTLQDRVRELEGAAEDAEVTEQTILADATQEDIEAAAAQATGSPSTAAEGAKGGGAEEPDDETGEGEQSDDIIVA